MRFLNTGTLRFLALLALPFIFGGADYAQELRDQAVEAKKNHPSIGREYFHDMGIIIRKMSDAGFSEMTAEFMRGLFAVMNDFVKGEVESINEQYEKDAFQATRRLQELTRSEKYYQPPEDFLTTPLGKALTGDLVQGRANALDALGQGCTPESILQGVQAIKKTGLFNVNSSPEIDSMRKLTDTVNACFSWKTEIVFSREQEFETLYEKGLLKEDARLRLESSRSDLTQARWVGEWVYRYTGRDGKGEGVSQAILNYHKGEDFAGLVISTSRVSSTGRMNFPNSYSNEKRTLEVSGTPIHPQFVFYGKKLAVTGPEQKK